MEHHANVAILPFASAWSDVGSWNAVAELTPADVQGNRLHGQGFALHSSNTFVPAPHRPVVALGTHDLLVVDTPDALLFAATFFQRAAIDCKDLFKCSFRRRKIGRTISVRKRYPRHHYSVANHFLGKQGAQGQRIGALSAERVVHLAARVHVMRDSMVNSYIIYAVNVDGTLSLAREAAAAGVKRFVFVSSVKVNGESTQPERAFTAADAPNPQDAYGQSKHEAEQGLRQLSVGTGMEVVIIPPPLVYCPFVNANFAALMRALQRGWPLPLGAVHNQRSLVALDNLVDFIVYCITHPQAANQIFLVSDGQDLSTTELVPGMAQAAGVPARLLPVPVWALQAGATLLGKGDAVQRLCGNLQVDMSKARSLLGWVPPVSVEEGLRRAMGYEARI